MTLLDIHRAYTSERGFTVYPTDIGGTAAQLAKVCPQRILVSPWGGWDTVLPFVVAGKSVSVLSCSPFGHPHACMQIRQIIREWPFADQLECIVGCDK